MWRAPLSHNVTPVDSLHLHVPTAAIIVIGNEILSGKVADCNSPYLIRALRALGVDVRRVTVIPDDVARIAEEVAYCRGRWTWVFTTGGVGPTHDDVTMAGVALGVEAPLVRHPDMERLVKMKYGDAPNAAALKMAEVPQGTTLIYSAAFSYPVTCFDNLFIFPGVPETLVRKFEATQERFRSVPFHLTEIYVTVDEAEIAAALTQTAAAFPALRLGSYPRLDQPDYKVVLTLESKDVTCVEEAARLLRALLPHDSIRPPAHC